MSSSPRIHPAHENGRWRAHSTNRPLPFSREQPSGKEKRKEILSRFFANFTGPVVWVLEAATIALIIAFRSTDFVRPIVVANLAVIVVMMAFKSSLCVWQESNADDRYGRNSTSTAGSHHA